MAALALSAPIYGLLQWQLGHLAYLDWMLITLILLFVVMAGITALNPLKAPKPLPQRADFDMSTSPRVILWGTLEILAVVIFFAVFR